MIKVFCTKKITDLLPEKPKKFEGETDPLNRWMINLIKIDRKNVILGICTETRFGFLLWNVTKRQYAKLEEVITKAIRDTLTSYGFKPELIDKYVSENVELCTGASRTDAARISSIGRDFQSVRILRKPDNMLDISFVRSLNRHLYNSENGYGYPIVSMIEKFREQYGEDPIKQRAFVLETELDLERYAAKRTIIVPAGYTFCQLHRILQETMDWSNAHLYEFELSDELVISDDEDEYDDREIASARENRLEDVLDKGDEFLYRYDFGDNWEVTVRVSDIIDDHNKPWASLSLCEGAAPPEDVGGVYGYLDFRDAYNDPDNPEHDDVIEWVGYRWKPEPNIRGIANRIEHI